MARRGGWSKWMLLEKLLTIGWGYQERSELQSLAQNLRFPRPTLLSVSFLSTTTEQQCALKARTEIDANLLTSQVCLMAVSF